MLDLNWSRHHQLVERGSSGKEKKNLPEAKELKYREKLASIEKKGQWKTWLQLLSLSVEQFFQIGRDGSTRELDKELSKKRVAKDKKYLYSTSQSMAAIAVGSYSAAGTSVLRVDKGDKVRTSFGPSLVPRDEFGRARRKFSLRWGLGRPVGGASSCRLYPGPTRL